MRGDSVRDLYAKTLALLGLGVLAGVGAFVDYLPTAAERRAASLMPAAVETDAAPAVSAPVSGERPIAVERSEIAAVRPAVAAPVAIAMATADRPAAQIEIVPALPVTAMGSLESIGTAVSLGAPPEPDVMPVVVFASAGREVTLGTPLESASGEMAANIDSSDGFFSSALKKTGNTIVKGGARTGASILDMFRVVNGAMRKALPNLQPYSASGLGL